MAIRAGSVLTEAVSVAVALCIVITNSGLLPFMSVSTAHAQPVTIISGAQSPGRVTKWPSHVQGVLATRPSLAPISAAPAPNGTTVTVTPPIVNPSGVTVITASGFSSGEHLLLTFADGSTGYGLADAAGKLEGYVYSVPSGTVPGTYRISLHGLSSGRNATAEVTVAARPAAVEGLDVSPLLCVQGATFAVSGSGFTPKETVTIHLDNAPIDTATADGTGSFTTGPEQVPFTLSPGLHEVSAAGRTSGVAVAAVLTILASPALVVLAPSSLVAGALTTLAGSGFAAKERVVISVDGKPVSSVMSDQAGKFSVRIGAGLGAGRHTVTVTGSASHRSAVANLDITVLVKPVLTLHPATARRGDRVVVGGTRYVANEVVLARIDGHFEQAIAVDSRGTFAGLSFLVPAWAPLGWNIITVTGVQSARVGSVRLHVAPSPPLPTMTRTRTVTPTDTSTARPTSTYTATPTVKPTPTATSRPKLTASPTRIAVASCDPVCTLPLAHAPLAGTHAPYGNAGLLAEDTTVGRAFIALPGSNRFQTVDLAAGRLIPDRTTGSAPWMMAVNTATHRLFVANGVGDSIGAYDSRTGQAVGPAVPLNTVSSGGAPYALAADVRTNRLFVIAGRRICALDAATTAIVGCVVSGDPYSLAVSNDGSRVYVVDQMSPSTMLVLDGHSGKLITSTSLGNALPWAVAAARAKDGELVSLDGTVGLVVGKTLQAPVRVGATARAILVDPRTGHAFVLDPADGAVAMLDSSHGKLLRVVKVGSSPGAAALDSARGLVYVTNQGSGTISVLSASTGRVLRTVNAGTQPVAVAVDDRLGLVLVLNGGIPETDYGASIMLFKSL